MNPELSTPRANPEFQAPTPETGGNMPKPERSGESSREHEQREQNMQGVDRQTQAPPPTVVPLPPPPAALPAMPAQQTSDDAVGPTLAADDDLIEKEWVDKAKNIISETQNDPYRREKEVNKLQADYLRKRYGKELGISN